jgi:predicted nuclease with TOPRIM domain
VADVRKVVGQLAGDPANPRSVNGREHWGIGEVTRANEQLRAEATRLKQQIEVLEQENRRLSEANEVVKQHVGEVSDCCPKVKKDLATLDREHAKLKDEIKSMKGTQDPLVEAVGQPKGQLAGSMRAGKVQLLACRRRSLREDRK